MPPPVAVAVQTIVVPGSCGAILSGVMLAQLLEWPRSFAAIAMLTRVPAASCPTGGAAAVTTPEPGVPAVPFLPPAGSFGRTWLANVTGGDSYCTLFVSAPDKSNKVALILMNQGKYPVYDISVKIDDVEHALPAYGFKSIIKIKIVLVLR